MEECRYTEQWHPDTRSTLSMFQQVNYLLVILQAMVIVAAQVAIVVTSLQGVLILNMHSKN